MSQDSDRREIIPARVLAVTAGLILVGMLVGAICGGLALGLVLLLTGAWRTPGNGELWIIGGFFGAILGAITAPLLGWLFLRRVPLGRGILQAAVGTIIGGALGWVAPGGPLLGATAGCTVAAVRLFIMTRGQGGTSLTLPAEDG